MALAACGGTVVFDAEGGGGRGDGDGGAAPLDATTTNASAASGETSAGSTGSLTSTEAATGATSSASGLTWMSCGGSLLDAEVDACAREYCCAQMAACLDEPSSCIDDEGRIDFSSDASSALYVCLTSSDCAALQICESGLQFTPSNTEDMDDARCLQEKCCEELELCTMGGEDVHGCFKCLNGWWDTDLERCAPAADCSLRECDFELP